MKLTLNLSQINLEESTHQTNRSMNTARNTNKNLIPLDVLENCLDSLDLFKEMLDGIPHMKNRVVRDVRKSIEVEIFRENDIIYDINQKATAVYFCLKGSISITILSQKTSRNLQGTHCQITSPELGIQEPVHVQIDKVEAGEGFGEAEFISEIKRSVRAAAKQDGTVVGRLQLQSVAEVLENYKMRVYYKKRDLFAKCPLFQTLSQPKLEFIINNTKLMKINISHKLTEEGDAANLFYLINKGKMKMWKKNQYRDEESPVYFSKVGKYRRDSRKKLDKKIMGGLLQEGHFIGDIQIALDRNHAYNVEAVTQEVELYYCDKRIVLSQMTEEDLAQAEAYYLEREQEFKRKIEKFNEIQGKLLIQKQKDLQLPLTLDQIKLKRKLLRRHLEHKPSLIGSSSPRDIAKMIDRKRARIPLEMNTEKLPSIQVFPSYSQKRRSYQQSSFSPIPIVSTVLKRNLTQGCSSSFLDNPQDDQDPKIYKAKSMVVNIKNSKSINLAKVKKTGQQNLAVVGQVLGQYNKIGGIHSLNQIIENVRRKKL